MTDNYLIPRANAPLAQGGTAPTREWYNFLRGLYELSQSSDANVQAELTALCYKLGSPDGTISNIPALGQVTTVQGIDSVLSNGLNYVQLRLDGDILTAPALTFYGAINAGSKGWQPYSTNFQKTTTAGVDYLDLIDLANSGTGALLAITRDSKGRVSGTKAATITGTAGDITVANGDAVAGLPTIDLADVTDSGLGTFKLLTRDTKGRLSGTKTGSASDVPAVNTTWKVITGSDVQAALNAIDVAELNARSTGVRYGMQMTLNGTSAIDISAGAGGILNNSTPSNPTYTFINFPGATNIALASTTSPITYWSINSSNTVIQRTTAPTPDLYRTEIQLGSTTYNGGVITQINYRMPSVQQRGPQIEDLFDALGFMNLGIYPYANGANLNFNMTAGRVAAYGSNFFTDALDPNFNTFAVKIPVTFRYGTQSSQGATNTTTVDVANYDVGGVITAISGASTRCSIHTVWQIADGSVRLQYGQSVYASLSEALANISTRAFIPNPVYQATGNIVGAIIAQKGATDLSNATQATFVKANKFGEFASGSGSTSSVVSFNGRSGVVIPVSGDYTTDLVTEATNLYFTQPRVLATPLTGLSTATSTPITASDTVLSAAGKLQAQITGLSGAPGYIDGLVMQWVSGTALTMSSGTAYIEGLGYAYQATSPIAKTALSLTASTWCHVYLYDNAGTPDVEIVTTAPATPYNGTARSKTGDTSRRYVGIVRTDSSGNIYAFKHHSGGLIAYMANIISVPFVVVNAGVSTTPASFSVAALVPITSTAALLQARNTDSSVAVVFGTSDQGYTLTASAFQSLLDAGSAFVAPVNTDSSQSVQYMFRSAPTGVCNVRCVGYLFDR